MSAPRVVPGDHPRELDEIRDEIAARLHRALEISPAHSMSIADGIAVDLVKPLIEDREGLEAELEAIEDSGI